METIAERYDTATRTRTRFEPNHVLLQDDGTGSACGSRSGTVARRNCRKACCSSTVS
jgi:hypothetical protein